MTHSVLILGEETAQILEIVRLLNSKGVEARVVDFAAFQDAYDTGTFNVVVGTIDDLTQLGFYELAGTPPNVVAWLLRPTVEQVRSAMRAGAVDFVAASDPPARSAKRIHDWISANDGSRGDSGGDSVRLREQLRELTERYVRQSKSFEEAQDIFYLDLSRMMTIFENIMDGIVFSDMSGHVTMMNPVAEDLLGVKTIFAIGRKVSDFPEALEIRDEIASDQNMALALGDSQERTVELVAASGQTRYLKLRTTPVVDYTGEGAGVLTVVQDVTAEVKADQSKNRYLSIVSHELRTPLTGIKTFSTMMAKGMLGELNEQQGRVVESIREQTARLEHEVDKLICVSRIESGDFGMDQQLVEINEIIEAVCAPFRQAVRDRGIDFDVPVLDEVVTVPADRTDLIRAVRALVENAVKFTPDGGKIRVWFEVENETLTIHVEDDGPGIDARYQRRIFEKYFQVEDPLTRQHGGAGLGLPLAQGVAEAHGGQIQLISEPEAGAHFKFHLPIALSTEDLQAGQDPDSSDQARLAASRKDQ